MIPDYKEMLFGEQQRMNMMKSQKKGGWKDDGVCLSDAYSNQEEEEYNGLKMNRNNGGRKKQTLPPENIFPTLPSEENMKIINQRIPIIITNEKKLTNND